MKKFVFIFIVFALFQSCRKSNMVYITTNKKEIFANDIVFLKANCEFDVQNYEWKILEFDSIFSTEQEVKINFPKKGNTLYN